MATRTPLMRQVRRLMAIAHYAEHHRLPTADAIGIIEAEVARRRAAALDLRGSRRSFLKGAGATLVGGGIVGAGLLGRPAWGAAPRKTTARIAIVGAGIGGLSAASTLLGKGVSADVYEARERVGGRIYSLGGAFPGAIDLPGQVTELGGEFIDTSHTTMRGYANAFGLALEDVLKIEGDALYYVNGQHHSEEEVVDDYRDFVAAMSDDLRVLSNSPTADHFTPDDVVLDYTNLDEYLVTRGASPFLTDLLRESYRNEYGRDVSEQSCLNFLGLIHADKRTNWEPWGVFSDERFHVIGGNQQIPEALAATLGGALKLGHRLEAARRNADGSYRLTFAQTAGPIVDVDYDFVLFAIPFSTLRNVALDGSLGLPSWKTDAIQNLQYGWNAKMVLAFDGRPWRDAGSSGSFFAYGSPNLSSGWESDPTRSTPTSAVFVDYSGGQRGLGLNPADPAGEAEAWLAEFDQMLPGAASQVRRDGAGDPVATIQHWPSDPNNLGAYTCNQPGYFTTIADNEGKRVDNLLFAGEHADSFWAFQGWMEGGALSGIAAATEIIKDVQH